MKTTGVLLAAMLLTAGCVVVNDGDGDDGGADTGDADDDDGADPMTPGDDGDTGDTGARPSDSDGSGSGGDTGGDTGGGASSTAGDDGTETGGPGTGSTDTGNESSGGSTSSDDGSAAALSFDSDVLPIIADNCGCHRSGSPAAGLDMTDDAAYESLVGQPSSNGLPYVTPGDPDQSYMAHKLEGTQEAVSGGGGNQMPLGDDLSNADVATIVQWIADGAQ